MQFTIKEVKDSLEEMVKSISDDRTKQILKYNIYILGLALNETPISNKLFICKIQNKNFIVPAKNKSEVNNKLKEKFEDFTIVDEIELL